MDLFNLQEFKKLAQRHKPHCVSIYIPTHRVNEEGDAMQRDQIQLKNQLQEAEKQLTAFGMKESAIAGYLKPITDLLEKTEFWLHHSDGLAIFLSGSELHVYRLPYTFAPICFVGTHFYLKPLAPLADGSNRHFLLNLSLGGVELCEVTDHSYDVFQTSKKLPDNLADVVGSDYEEKHLQQRTGQGERGEATGIYHGHGASNQSEKKEEALRYFRKIDDIITNDLHDIKSPLVVACVDYLFPIYREANTYNHLVDQHVSGNMEEADPRLPVEKSREIFQERDEAKRNQKKMEFEKALSDGEASFKKEDAVPAAIGGRVETLFLSPDEHLWGTYDEETHSITTSKVRRVGESDLLDLAATYTVLNGGSVHLLPKNELPAPETKVNAIFRYSRAE